MKQHVFEEQLKALNYTDRLTLISLAAGLDWNYLNEEYDKKNEDAYLRSYGFQVKIGELIEIIYSYTRIFPTPQISNSGFSLDIEVTEESGTRDKFSSGVQSEYIDALFEIVKQLFDKKYISVI